MHYLVAVWILVKFSQFIAFFVIRVSRWLIQALRDGFPDFDRWIENDYDPAMQRFRKTIEGIILLIFMLLLIPPLLLIHRCRYIFWFGLYLRHRREATNPETRPEQLRKLGEGKNPITQKAIASNPNTSLDLLFKLGETFPKQLFANPIFDLLLLEDPNLLKTMPRDTLKSLLQLKEIPVSFLEQAASYYPADAELMKVIVKHPKTPKYILEKIAQHN